MNDWKLAIGKLEEIIKQSGDVLRSGERAGLYAAARVLLTDLEEYAIDNAGGHGYAREKIISAKGHIGAILGFDIDNGHDAAQHRTWAYGDLGTLKSVLDKTGEA